MPYVWFCCIVAIWGTSFLLMKRAAVALSPVAIGEGRVLFGAAVLGVLWWSMREPLRVRRADWGSLAGVVLLGFAWPYCLQPELITRHGSAFIGMTVGFTPLLTLGVSIIVLRTRPTWRQLIGVGGALACLCLLMWDGAQRSIPLGDLALAFTVPLSYALANNWIRRSLAHVPPIELSVLCLIGSGLVLLPLVGISKWPTIVVATDWWTSLAAVAILGVIGTGVATCLFLQLVQEQGPLFAAMTTNVVPVIAVLLGWWDEESITPRQVAALAGVLMMVVLVQYKSAQPSRHSRVSES